MSNKQKQFCCVCIEVYNDIKSIGQYGEDKITHFEKLKTCIPTEAWRQDYHICSTCIKSLHIAYEFVQFCVKKSGDRLKTYEESKRTFICIPCSKSFKIEKYLKQHNTRFHNNRKEKKAVEVLENKEEINVKTEDNELQLQLDETNRNQNESEEDICIGTDYNISDDENLSNDEIKQKIKYKKKIRKKRLPKKKGPFKCEYCGEIFRLHQFLLNHVRSRHTFEKPFSCDQCNACYRNKGSLTLHKRAHTDERPYICTMCGKRFRSTADLNVHYETHSAIRAYTCSECGKSYKTNSNLRMHRLSAHVKPEDYKFECKICNKKFAFNANLEYHMKRHENVRNFSCYICERKFLFKHDLEKHILTHGNDKPHICEICKREYKSRHGWRKHLKTAHNMGTWRPPKIPEKRHMCQFCPKEFLYNNKLQRHLLTHTGERPFRCEHCVKCFKDRYSLNVHIKNDHPDVTIKDEM